MIHVRLVYGRVSLVTVGLVWRPECAPFAPDQARGDEGDTLGRVRVSMSLETRVTPSPRGDLALLRSALRSPARSAHGDYYPDGRPEGISHWEGTVPATSQFALPRGAYGPQGSTCPPKRIGGLLALCATASLASPAI
jgi:hypothetical protein